MSLFTPEARARAVASAASGLHNLEHRPIRGLRHDLRTPMQAMRDIRAYEQAHGLKPRNLSPLVWAHNMSQHGFDLKYHVTH